MALPGYYLYQLSGQENYAWSVRVSGNWRFTFLFEGEDVIKPLGFTITEAAQKLGVSRKTLSELVHQKSSLSPEMALRISEARLGKTGTKKCVTFLCRFFDRPDFFQVLFYCSLSVAYIYACL